jgi:hypothetical protein
MKMLIDERLGDDPEFAAVGRTVGQAIDVDGVTHLRGPVDGSPGDMVDVMIVEALDYDLVAEVARAR